MITRDSNNNRIVQSPQANVAKDEVLVVQEATTKIKEIIIEGITYNHSKEIVQQKLNKIIAKYVNQIPESRKEKVKRSLIQIAQKDYFVVSQNIATINQNMANKISSQTVPGFSVNVFQDTKALLTENKIRGYVTDERKGSALIKDYKKQVRAVVKALTVDPPEIQLSDVNNKPYKMSTRSYAEMSVRYEANLEDVKNLKANNVKLVWTSSHADASPRCQPYQGKLYSLDGTSGKTEDGISYTPLDKALLGPKGDGNGIINGYNCRHYLIEYKPGSKAPIDYDKATVMRENQINNKQRNFESNIRQLKLQERLAKKSGDKELAKRLNNRWKILELEYQKFSLQNDRAYFPWRTAIIRDEAMNRTKWGDELTKDIKHDITFEKKEKIRDELEKLTDNNYADKIIRDEKTQMVTCTFENKTQMDSYKIGHRVDFKNTIYPREIKKEKDEKVRENKILEFENKRISSYINLKERLHDEYLSKEYCEKLGIANAEVVVLGARYNKDGSYKQGAAVHISTSHSDIGNSAEHINNVLGSFVAPKELRIAYEKERPFRYVFSTKFKEDKIYYLLADKIDDSKFEFFDVFIREKEEFDKKLRNDIIEI